METTTLAELLRSAAGRQKRYPKDPALLLHRTGGGVLSVTVDGASGCVLLRAHWEDGSPPSMLNLMPDELEPLTCALLQAQGIPLDLKISESA